jgi:hypothetical protein
MFFARHRNERACRLGQALTQVDLRTRPTWGRRHLDLASASMIVALLADVSRGHDRYRRRS